MHAAIQTGHAPAKPVAYQYDSNRRTFYCEATPPAIIQGIEHLAYVAPKNVPIVVAPTYPLHWAAACLAGIALSFLALSGELPGMLLPGLALMLVGAAFFISKARGGTHYELRVLDPSVDADVTNSNVAATFREVLQRLNPAFNNASMRMIGEFYRDGANNISQLHKLSLTSSLNISLQMHSSKFFRYDVSYRGSKKVTTTERYFITTVTIKPASLPADIARRIDALGAGSMPAIPNATPTEVGVKAGEISTTYQSKYELSPANMAAIGNALGHIAGLNSAIFQL
jgi:hypothetical protein